MRIGVLVCGSGLLDGSDPTQVVCAQLDLAQHGDEAIFAAPDLALRGAVHPLSTAPEEPGRNALSDAARLVRGECLPLAQLRALDLHALLIPGGLGAAKSLSHAAIDGWQAPMLASAQQLIQELAELGRPLAALDEGMLPLAQALRGKALQLADPGLSALRQDLLALGAQLIECEPGCADGERPIFSATSARGIDPIDAATKTRWALARLREAIAKQLAV